MISEEVYWRARTILKRGEVILCDDSDPSSGHLHWQVKARSGKWTDVWKTRLPDGSIKWSCNAVGEEKNNHSHEKFGCVFDTTIREEPFCSHTKACELWLTGVDNE